MRLYRLGEDVNPEGWPFLRDGHAFLANGTPLTECDPDGRVVPVRSNAYLGKASCSDGELSLADRQNGIEALARALDKGDAVRAPILLLQLQIDPVPRLAKFNPWHKPKGPGGGQFTTGPEGGGAANGTSSGALVPQPVEWDMGSQVISTYQPGIFGKDIDDAHSVVISLVQMAMLKVGNAGFKPGMPGYGQELHMQLREEVEALHDPYLRAEAVFLGGTEFSGGPIPPGASVTDVVYGPPGERPLIAWELKSGRAADTSSAAFIAQRARAQANLGPNTLYEPLLVVGRTP